MNKEEGHEQQQGKDTDSGERHPELMGGALTLGLVVLSNLRQQWGDLPVTLARTITVGTVTGITDIVGGTVDVAFQHQFIGQFPHRSLVHGSIADISQYRLRQPEHHLC